MMPKQMKELLGILKEKIGLNKTDHEIDDW
jgi:hypothetical protein